MNRPDKHRPDHDNWDQGGYCNELVTDDDGCGEICGYRTAVDGPLDPFPYVITESVYGTSFRAKTEAVLPVEECVFDPRPGYAQEADQYLPLDPLPWVEEGRRFKKWVGPYLPVGQLATEFQPREGFNQNRRRYP